jgi:hypothetical protein
MASRFLTALLLFPSTGTFTLSCLPAPRHDSKYGKEIAAKKKTINDP